MSHEQIGRILRALYIFIGYLLIWLVVFPCLVLSSIVITIVSHMSPIAITREIIKMFSLEQFLTTRGIKEYVLFGIRTNHKQRL